MVEILKIVLAFISESPVISFFLAPFVFAAFAYVLIIISATVVGTAEAIASIFKKDIKEKKK